ncbi:hypothetical protein [uncultured Mediterranean phage]|nr:hypothetical protein [uncultured Mediterranean phage]
MVTYFINWIKGLFSKKEESVVLEETSVEEKETVAHCSDHNRFRKNCPSCLSAVGVV